MPWVDYLFGWTGGLGAMRPVSKLGTPELCSVQYSHVFWRSFLVPYVHRGEAKIGVRIYRVWASFLPYCRTVGGRKGAPILY